MRCETPRALCNWIAVRVGRSTSEDRTRAPCDASQRDNPPFRVPSSRAEQDEIFCLVCVSQKSKATDQLRTSHSMKFLRSRLGIGISNPNVCGGCWGESFSNWSAIRHDLFL